MKFEEYISGVDKETLRFELRPDVGGAGASTSKVASFSAKETVTVVVTSDKRRHEDEEIIKGLERKIAELEEEVRQSKQEIHQLREEDESLT